MRQFLKLIDVANESGIITKFSEARAQAFAVEAEDIHTFENCQPMVFANKYEGPLEIDEDVIPETGPVTADLDAPFKVFSYEMIDGPITSPRMDDEMQIYCWCVIAIELAPKQFGFYGLMEERGPSRIDGHTYREWLYVVKTNSFAGITNEFLKRLNSEKVGVENVRTRVKLGSGKSKVFRRIRRIIHVAPKSYVKKYQAEGQHQRIDYSHRFLVRGHWRKIAENKIGKDRAENYCVPGFTWVSEFEKGPDNAPLISKTRLIE